MINPEFSFKTKPAEIKLELNLSKAAELFIHEDKRFPLYSETQGVRKWKNFFSNNPQGRAQVEVLLKRQHKITEIKEIFRKNDLPEELAFVAFVESYFNPNARSHAGAVGVWQFMPHTARSFGLRVNWWIDERLNPEKSTQAAVSYFKKLYRMLGDWDLVIMAYNYGEYGLKRKIREYGIPECYDELPRETRSFLVKIKALIQLFNEYDFARIDSEDDEVYVQYPMKGYWELEEIAYKLHFSRKALKKLNPEYKHGYLLKGTNYIRVPEKYYTKLKKLKSQNRADGKVIKLKIKKGDTVYAISRKFNLGYKKLMRINNISNAKNIRPGQTLYIPIS
ncbi:transglycosylase SLT domain-containing protein [bacterium]|nr:transglycosylase SLT domain-containing protein [bacterium]